jgi:hypothetical protein
MINPNYFAAGVAGAIGFACTALDIWGTAEWTYGLEGRVSYFVVAGPLLAFVAAVSFALGEFYWCRDMKRKGLAWFLMIVPCAAVVYFATAERIHLGKAGAEAERSAYRRQAERALESRDAAKVTFKDAAKAASEARAWKQQGGPEFRKRITAETDAEAALTKAETALLKAEALAKAESPYKMPLWLLPVALFLVGLVGTWTAFGTFAPQGPDIMTQTRTAQRKRRKSKAKAKPSPRLKLVARNDNRTAAPPAA